MVACAAHLALALEAVGVPVTAHAHVVRVKGQAGLQVGHPTRGWAQGEVRGWEHRLGTSTGDVSHGGRYV